MVRNRDGSMQVLLALAFLLIATAGFGLWALLHQYRQSVELQLRLDRCVGRKAQDFRDSLQKIEGINGRMRKLRAAIAAAEALFQPEAAAPLQLALSAEAIREEAILAGWKLKQVSWQVAPCGKPGDRAGLLPGLPFVPEPPDTVGPKPLKGTAPPGSRFHFQAEHRPRRAAADVSRFDTGEIDGGIIGKGWTARWSRYRPAWPGSR